MRAQAAWTLAILALLVFMLGPLVLVVLFSVSANPLIAFPIERLTLDWYRGLFADIEFRRAFANSIVIALATGGAATLTGTMAALALIRLRGGIAGPILAFLALPVMMPPLVIGVSLIVLYVRAIGVELGLLTVIGGHLLITQPFVILIVMARMATFDHVTVESARDLGAGRWTAFRRVVLPQIATAIIGAALMAMAVSLDDFIITVFTIGSGNTLSTFVWGKVRTTLDPSINAIGTIILAMTVGATILAVRLSRYRG